MEGRVQCCSLTSCIISRHCLVQRVPDVGVTQKGEVVKYCFKAFMANHKCCTGDLVKNAIHSPAQLKQNTDGPLGMNHVSVASYYITRMELYQDDIRDTRR